MNKPKPLISQKSARPDRLCLRSLALLGLTVGVLGGCSSSSTPSTADATGTQQSAAPGASLPVPFQALVESSEGDRKALHDSEEAAVAKCMKEQGFTYTPAPYQPAPASPQPFGNVELATKEGYGEQGQGEQAVPDDSQNAGLNGLSNSEKQAWVVALNGSPRGPEAANDPNGTVVIPGGPTISFDPNSCVSKGRGVVYGDDLQWHQLTAQMESLQGRVFDLAIGDEASTNPTYAAALADWHACMSDQGYDYPAPLKAADSFVERAHQSGADPTKLRAEEIKTAIADANCVHSTKMFDTAVTLIGQFEKQVTNENEAVITAYSEMQKASVDRANKLLGSG